MFRGDKCYGKHLKENRNAGVREGVVTLNPVIEWAAQAKPLSKASEEVVSRVSVPGGRKCFGAEGST